MSTVTAEHPVGAEDPGGGGRPAPEWRVLAHLEKTAIGTRAADGAASVRHGERPGCVLYGPYWQLAAGAYRLDFRCRSGKPRMPGEPVLGVEVIAMNRFQLAWLDLTAEELHAGIGSLDFAVPETLGFGAGDEARLEFRFFHLGNADLTITAVDLHGLEAHEIRPQAATRWRMLGRLQKTSIGKRTGACVTVHRGERAGCLLDGCHPLLQLPEGHYRLSFQCDAGASRAATQPVLSVEVIAQQRWQQRRGSARWNQLFGAPTEHGTQLAHRSFTAPDLVSGTTAVEFAIPPEFGLEAGEDVVIDVRFIHSGNAGLTVRAVDLCKIAVAEAPARAPAMISRGPKRRNVVIIGNCQAQTVCEALVRTRDFNRRLNAKYHFVGLQQNLHELGKAELESSEVLLVQDIRDWENYPLRPHIRDDVEIVRFPLLHFASLWPFDHYNGPGDKEAYEREWPNLTFLYHDGLLARLRKEIRDREERLAAYRSLEVGGVINFVRLHDFEKRRLTAMDKQFGFAIGQFILDNFQRRRLFYTTNHPNAEIFAMLMQYLLGHLGIDGAFRPAAILDHLQRLQVPVHPKVAQALGVRWADENTKYLYRGEEIRWETYVRRYIDHYG
jgi:Polysaccharide biosynthesis enzyme WcbI